MSEYCWAVVQCIVSLGQTKAPVGTFTVALLFPTCQVRVVRFYVSLFSSFSRTPPPPSSSSSCRDPVSSVWRAGLQPRAREFSVARRTPSSVLCAGPQLRSCEFSVACRAPTAIMRVQCGVPDLNCDGKDW